MEIRRTFKMLKEIWLNIRVKKLDTYKDVIMLLVNLQQKVAFDTYYTNKFLIRICSRTHYQFLECTKVLCKIVNR